jgi:hypothetical protein
MNTADLTQTPINADGSFEVHLQKSGQTLFPAPKACVAPA